jgi:Ran-interacting Mog1 protein
MEGGAGGGGGGAAAASFFTEPTAGARGNVGFVEKGLFGGAMSCLLPSNGWIDTSDIRQVPDNQEVFMENVAVTAAAAAASASTLPNPAMLVIEIVEYQSAVSNDDAMKYFWDNLCEDNNVDPHDCNSSIFHEIPNLPIPVPPSGQQQPQAVASSLWTTTCGAAETCNNGSITIKCCTGYQKIAIGRDVDVNGNDRSAQQEVNWVIVNQAVVRLPKYDSEILISLSQPIPSTVPPTILPDVDQMIHPVWLNAVTTLKIHDWTVFG